MTILVLLLACGTAAAPSHEPTPEANVPAPTAPVVLPPADWTLTDDMVSAVGSHFVKNTARLKPPRTSMVVDDAIIDKLRNVDLRKQRGVAMPVDSDTAHWLADAVDTDSGDTIVLDYTLEWRPPPPGTELPGYGFEVSNVEIQSVAGVDRYSWVQQGDLWVRRDVAPP